MTRNLWRACALFVTLLAGAFLGGGFGGTAAIAGASASQQWQWPLAVPAQPTVVRGFDPPATPYGAGHRGVDLAGQPGLPVRAAGGGTVGYAGLLAGRGVVTVLHAGRLRTTYEPLVVSVRPGDRVAAGALLGHLAAGHSGCPAPACLHWGLLRGETYLDPLSLLGVGRVRLLPLAGAVPRAFQVEAMAAMMSVAGALPMVLWLGARRGQRRCHISRGPRRRSLRRRRHHVRCARSRVRLSAGRPSSPAAG